MNTKFYRTKYNAQIAGVCNGLAEHFDRDVSLVRIAFALSVLLFGNGIILYLVLWVVLPEKHFPTETM